MSKDDHINETINNVLAEKVSSLEQQVKTLTGELESHRKTSLDSTLGYLRMHQVVFVSFGQNAQELWETLAKAYGSDYANTVMQHLYILDNAPLPDHLKIQIREAFQGGCSRW